MGVHPKVSVCVPTYNRAQTLRHTMQAISCQSYSDWELIVSDDASTDDTYDVVAQFKDERVRYSRNSRNLGLYANFNRCIQLASGDYVAIYHDHDIYLPTILERSVLLLDKHPGSSFVHSAILEIDDANNPVAVDISALDELIPGHTMRRHLAKGWTSPVMAATAVVRRAAYQQVGLYDDRAYGMSCDLDMWFRLCKIGDAAYISDPQAIIRVRGKDHALSGFKWATIIGELRMHRDHIQQEFKGDSFEHLYESLKGRFHSDLQLLSLGIRAILLESPDIIDEGESLLQREAGFYVAFPYRFIRRSSFAQEFAKKFVLPIHYQKVRKYHASRRRAAMAYMEKNPELRMYLRLV